MAMNTYHKRFLNSFSSENVIGLFSRYKNAHKEITESWAMLEAAKSYYPFPHDDTLVVVVGDGASPRTGAIFAYFTKAQVLSIDPAFNMVHWREHCEKQKGMGFPIRNLVVSKDKVENITVETSKHLLMIWPHSHADMNGGSFKGKTKTTIAMPCCVKIPDNWMDRHHICYRDSNVLSPQNTIHVWV
jgi:hypothetical protein